MIRIYPEQLSAQLREGLRACYLLTGNEPLLLQESADAIRASALAQGFEEHLSFTLDAQTDWDSLFMSCQSLSLFAQRQTLTLQFPENGPNAAIAEQLIKLAPLLHADILLICRMAKLSKAQENSAWFKALSAHAVLVPCQTPEQAQLPRWVVSRAKTLKLDIDDAAVQLLCYCYEGNLLALAQALERLSLQWPDGKLTLPRVEAAVSDAAHFTPYHWVDALLGGKSRRALHILQQLEREESEVAILLRTLQRDLMTLLHLQRHQSQQPLRTLMDQQRIWQNRRNLFTEALQRLDASRLQQAIHLLMQIELTLKQDYGQSVWPQLQTLSMLIANRAFPASLAHV
ncbi:MULTISPECIES: DNA polymerase III subunit delta [Pantoea]|jgi:DNA polymerase-3 subunit delta|uniref:DNA polymerase III subunit delta n=1 Tax=Pantoea ananas TaxID=553 RepID=A0A8A4K4R7_PANAN|nr:MULTISPECIES: DNA polymerase III subunit delta [Pantoea]AER33526.1 DNA polymerase III delta subunit HolA [Pantoea ananatis PA13]AMB75076.1 DNA polymerase III subunit delta [Pantoea ananatis]KNA29396.1 DNA polymerase III subunit delta [Pantoea ananatis]MCS4494014.1 DNA polymerase III subunit delta [Pantoea sp. B623]MCW1834368.1 DNA polymerase III subunit delta [Pantoea ananatis]